LYPMAGAKGVAQETCSVISGLGQGIPIWLLDLGGGFRYRVGWSAGWLTNEDRVNVDSVHRPTLLTQPFGCHHGGDLLVRCNSLVQCYKAVQVWGEEAWRGHTNAMGWVAPTGK